jgi:hypothetical protein
MEILDVPPEELPEPDILGEPLHELSDAEMRIMAGEETSEPQILGTPSEELPEAALAPEPAKPKIPDKPPSKTEVLEPPRKKTLEPKAPTKPEAPKLEAIPTPKPPETEKEPIIKKLDFVPPPAEVKVAEFRGERKRDWTLEAVLQRAWDLGADE